MYFFRNGKLLKQLDKFFQKKVSVNLCNTGSENQLHTPKTNTVKYGTKSLIYNAPLIFKTFQEITENRSLNIKI